MRLYEKTKAAVNIPCVHWVPFSVDTPSVPCTSRSSCLNVSMVSSTAQSTRVRLVTESALGVIVPRL